MEFLQNINGISVKAFYRENTISHTFLPLLHTLTAMQQTKQQRLLVFLAAPPAAGKSTLAAFLEQLSKTDASLTPIQVLGMDGFHRYQSDLLSHTVLRDGEEIPLVRIKGAPITFDLPRLRGRIANVAAGEDCTWPIYDRLHHDPLEDAIRVTGDIILLEGNYLLLDRPGWQDLQIYADYTIFLRADPADLQERLIARKTATSAASMAEAAAFVAYSDLPNALEVLFHSQAADLTLQMASDGDYLPL